MSVNTAIAERLSTIAQLLELLGEDRFRVLANQKAARVIESQPQDLAKLADHKAALMKIEGVGPKIADKIIEFCKTGRIQELEELRASVPAGLIEVLSIPGMGPKTVRMLWQEASVTDLAGLKRIIADGSILNLPRMGAKAVDKLKVSMSVMAEGQSRLALGVALPVAGRVALHMSKVKGIKQAAFAGSLRRGKETIGDIDILVATADHESAAEAFCTMPGVRQIIARGESKCSIRMSISNDDPRFGPGGESDSDAAVKAEIEGSSGHVKTGPSVQVDLRIVPQASWGAALMYFTGSKEHNVALRERALKKGLTLNEYGLFPLDKEDTPPQSRGVKPVAAKTEEDIYKALGIPYIPPEMREDHGELAIKSTPRLIEVGDIKAELHAHTTASDGAMSIEQLAEAARARGFHTIAVTDHSKSSAIAGGLPPKRLLEHVEAIHAARSKIKGITLLAGSEVDILADGSLDYDDALLAKLDVIVASPHSSLSQDSATATERLLKAIAHPRVHILGHPTGRLILRRRGLEPDMEALIAAAKKHEVALEINAHWLRLDLRDTHVKAAVDAGCLIAIDCDVHQIGDFDNLRYGVLTGRRGWLTPEQCINAWTAAKLHAWLKSKK